MASRSTTRLYPGTAVPGELSDVVDMILDKGLVIDLYARVCLMDFELAAIDGRMVVASIDTYLRLADAFGHLAATDRSAPRAAVAHAR